MSSGPPKAGHRTFGVRPEESLRILHRQTSRLGIAAALLIGQTSKEERERVVSCVRAGRVQVLVATVQLIGEGFDCPGLSTLVLATPIKFEGRLLQVAGRVVRPAAGKKAVIVDYVDAAVPLLRRSAAARRQVFMAW